MSKISQIKNAKAAEDAEANDAACKALKTVLVQAQSSFKVKFSTRCYPFERIAAKDFATEVPEGTKCTVCDCAFVGEVTHCYRIEYTGGAATTTALYVDGECFNCKHLDAPGDEDTACEKELYGDAVWLDDDNMPVCEKHVGHSELAIPVFDPTTQAREARKFKRSWGFAKLSCPQGLSAEDCADKVEFIAKVIGNINGHEDINAFVASVRNGDNLDPNTHYPGMSRHELGLICEASPIDGEPEAINAIRTGSHRAEPIQDRRIWDVRAAASPCFAPFFAEGVNRMAVMAPCIVIPKNGTVSGTNGRLREMVPEKRVKNVRNKDTPESKGRSNPLQMVFGFCPFTNSGAERGGINIMVCPDNWKIKGLKRDFKSSWERSSLITSSTGKPRKPNYGIHGDKINARFAGNVVPIAAGPGEVIVFDDDRPYSYSSGDSNVFGMIVGANDMMPKKATMTNRAMLVTEGIVFAKEFNRTGYKYPKTVPDRFNDAPIAFPGGMMTPMTSADFPKYASVLFGTNKTRPADWPAHLRPGAPTPGSGGGGVIIDEDNIMEPMDISEEDEEVIKKKKKKKKRRRPLKKKKKKKKVSAPEAVADDDDDEGEEKEKEQPKPRAKPKSKPTIDISAAAAAAARQRDSAAATKRDAERRIESKVTIKEARAAAKRKKDAECAVDEKGTPGSPPMTLNDDVHQAGSDGFLDYVRENVVDRHSIDYDYDEEEVQSGVEAPRVFGVLDSNDNFAEVFDAVGELDLSADDLDRARELMADLTRRERGKVSFGKRVGELARVSVAYGPEEFRFGNQVAKLEETPEVVDVIMNALNANLDDDDVSWKFTQCVVHAVCWQKDSVRTIIRPDVIPGSHTTIVFFGHDRKLRIRAAPPDPNEIKDAKAKGKKMSHTAAILQDFVMCGGLGIALKGNFVNDARRGVQYELCRGRKSPDDVIEESMMLVFNAYIPSAISPKQRGGKRKVTGTKPSRKRTKPKPKPKPKPSSSSSSVAKPKPRGKGKRRRIVQRACKGKTRLQLMKDLKFMKGADGTKARTALNARFKSDKVFKGKWVLMQKAGIACSKGVDGGDASLAEFRKMMGDIWTECMPSDDPWDDGVREAVYEEVAPEEEEIDDDMDAFLNLDDDDDDNNGALVIVDPESPLVTNTRKTHRTASGKKARRGTRKRSQAASKQDYAKRGTLTLARKRHEQKERQKWSSAKKRGRVYKKKPFNVKKADSLFSKGVSISARTREDMDEEELVMLDEDDGEDGYVGEESSDEDRDEVDFAKAEGVFSGLFDRYEGLLETKSKETKAINKAYKAATQAQVLAGRDMRAKTVGHFTGCLETLQYALSAYLAEHPEERDSDDDDDDEEEHPAAVAANDDDDDDDAVSVITGWNPDVSAGTSARFVQFLLSAFETFATTFQDNIMESLDHNGGVNVVEFRETLDGILFSLLQFQDKDKILRFNAKSMKAFMRDSRVLLEEVACLEFTAGGDDGDDDADEPKSVSTKKRGRDESEENVNSCLPLAHAGSCDSEEEESSSSNSLVIVEANSDEEDGGMQEADAVVADVVAEGDDDDDDDEIPSPPATKKVKVIAEEPEEELSKTPVLPSPKRRVVKRKPKTPEFAVAASPSKKTKPTTTATKSAVIITTIPRPEASAFAVKEDEDDGSPGPMDVAVDDDDDDMEEEEEESPPDSMDAAVEGDDADAVGSGDAEALLEDANEEERAAAEKAAKVARDRKRMLDRVETGSIDIAPVTATTTTTATKSPKKRAKTTNGADTSEFYALVVHTTATDRMIYSVHDSAKEARETQGTEGFTDSLCDIKPLPANWEDLLREKKSDVKPTPSGCIGEYLW